MIKLNNIDFNLFCLDCLKSIFLGQYCRNRSLVFSFRHVVMGSRGRKNILAYKGAQSSLHSRQNIYPHPQYSSAQLPLNSRSSSIVVSVTVLADLLFIHFDTERFVAHSTLVTSAPMWPLPITRSISQSPSRFSLRQSLGAYQY